MTKTSKILGLILTVCVIFNIILLSKINSDKSNINDLNKTKVIEKIVNKIVYKEPKDIISSITMSDLNSHLKLVYSHLSTKDRKRVLLSIAKASDKYKISPVVFYGLIAVESSFRPWITHHQVVIKGKRDNGIGLGGVVPYWWLDKLRKANILETKSDLYNIENNIDAIGFILAEYKTMKLIKGTNDSTTSALRRYFGGNYKSYTEKIRNQIGSIIFSKIYE